MEQYYRELEFVQHGDKRGKLVAIESGKDIPFEMKRVFFIYDMETGAVRGQHANKKSSFVFVILKGKCKIEADKGKEKETFILDKPYQGIYLMPMVWKKMYDFSEDAVLLVLSDEEYDALEYIYDYNEFLREVDENVKTFNSNSNIL